MRVLHISVLDKKATYQNRDGDIVCGNSDYVIEFAFDSEWAAHTEKIARFIWNGAYKDVTFTGTTCPVPIITGASEVEVGVYAGELSTTTPAVIGCQKSILCQSTEPGGIPFTKGEKGDPGVGETFDITIKSDRVGYSSDKTTAEAIAAYLDGKVLRVIYDNCVSTQVQTYAADADNLTGFVTGYVIRNGILYKFSLSNESGTDGVFWDHRNRPFVPYAYAKDNGKILGYVDDTTKWLDPSEIPGIDNVFDITVAVVDGKLTCDKSVSEIIAAYLAGKVLFAKRIAENFTDTSPEFRVNIKDSESLTGSVEVTFARDEFGCMYTMANTTGEDLVFRENLTYPFVPNTTSSDNGKILGIDGTKPKWLDPSEIPGIDNVFTVNFTGPSGDSYFTCDKTTSEIYTAHLAGKTLVGVLDNKYVSTLFYVRENTTRCIFFYTVDGTTNYREFYIYKQGEEERVEQQSSLNPFVPATHAGINGKILGCVDNNPQWISPSELGIGGANIITANSKAELPDPSTVEEGTVALVPSEGDSGGGGLPVAELTVDENGDYVITEAASAALSAAADMRMPIIITGQSGDGDDFVRVSVVANYIEQYGMRAFMATVVEQLMTVVETNGVWTVM